MMVAIAILAALVALSRNRSSSRPLTLDELSFSRTAQELGIDNRVPSNLRVRALGLGVVAGILRGEGMRITSAYRSRELSAAIDARSTTEDREDVTKLPGPGDHDQARGLDVAPPSPTRERAALEAVRAQVLASPVGPLVRQAIVETNHVHLRFREADLDALGAERERVA